MWEQIIAKYGWHREVYINILTLAEHYVKIQMCLKSISKELNALSGIG